MENENTEITPEEYKLRILKQRFAEKVTEYEDTIATLITNQTQLQQQFQQAQQQLFDLQSESFDQADPAESD